MRSLDFSEVLFDRKMPWQQADGTSANGKTPWQQALLLSCLWHPMNFFVSFVFEVDYKQANEILKSNSFIHELLLRTMSSKLIQTTATHCQCFLQIWHHSVKKHSTQGGASVVSACKDIWWRRQCHVTSLRNQHGRTGEEGQYFEWL